jgi:hypothetical protein
MKAGGVVEAEAQNFFVKGYLELCDYGGLVYEARPGCRYSHYRLA